ncbi:hypothetical protein B0H21DRAFT_823705 [Amylocystis lapponica]|nr:hypothetical protein B0H21DRAFT_823705 [Amylocystis lapponica]
MNSPPELASPATSASSGSPSPDELSLSPRTFVEESVAVSLSQFIAPSGSKRRLPGGNAVPHRFSARDTKSRRREDIGLGGRKNTYGEGRDMTRSQKDDLVDYQLVEQLRADFGDPFDDSLIKGTN